MFKSMILLSCAMLVVVSLSGCDPQPEDREFFVDRMRVLALKPDKLTAKRNETVKFSVLAQTPEFGTFDVSWSWCPYRSRGADKYTCPITKTRYKEVIEEASKRFNLNVPDDFFDRLPDFDLGKGADASISHNLGKQEALVLCGLTLLAAVDVDTSLQNYLPTVTCEQGFEISLRADVVDKKSGNQLVTRKSMFFETGEYPALRNPTILSYQIRPFDEKDSPAIAARVTWLDATKPHDEQWVDADAASLDLLKGYKYQLRILVDEDTLDVYRPQDLVDPNEPTKNDDPTGPFDNEKPTIPFAERLSYRWFTTIDALERDEDGDERRSNRANPEARFNVRPLELEDTRLIDLTGAQKAGIDEVCSSYPCRAWTATLAQDRQLGIAWSTLNFEIIE